MRASDWRRLALMYGALALLCLLIWARTPIPAWYLLCADGCVGVALLGLNYVVAWEEHRPPE